MRGINAQKAHYKCILLLPVKYLSWSGSNFTPVKKPYFTGLLQIVYAFWQQNGNII